jgi:hypothetical protein
MSIQELANPNVAKSLGLTTLGYWPAGVNEFAPANWTAVTLDGVDFVRGTITNVSPLLTADSVVTATMGGIPKADYLTFWLASANPSTADGGTITIYLAGNGGAVPTDNIFIDWAVHSFS